MAAVTVIELPEDIVTDILSRLPVKSLMRFRSVCKSLCCLFQNEDFIAKHHHYQTLYSNPTFIVKHDPVGEEDDRFSLLSCTVRDDGLLSNVVDTIFAQFPAPFSTHPIVLGSVNGVLCVYDIKDGNHLIALWNPATREFKPIPFPTIKPLPGSIRALFSNLGFGFDKETNDYKILIFIYNAFHRDVDCKEQVQLYSLKTDSWREIDSVDVITDSSRSLFNPYINGVHYWWAELPGRSDEPLILSFNFADEVFDELVPDIGFPLFDYDNYLLGLFANGLLAAVNYIEEDEGDKTLVTWLDILPMTEREVKDIWKVLKKVFYSRISYPCRILVFAEDIENELVLFDISTEQVYNLQLHGKTNSLKVVNYVETLVPINRIQEDKHAPFTRTRTR